MPNRLASSTSPYLLQHQHNPVDWFEWGDEAFGQARNREVPILLSVGYSACHWCHVMAHESFEDPVTAALMNERFVNVKVDREERPDVDAVYMNALTAMTGHGGWPMTVFMTPGGAPFYAGTYFPPERRHGTPGFPEVLVAVSDTWRDRAEQVATQAQTVVDRLAQAQAGAELGAAEPPTTEDSATALGTLARQFDHARGGFGAAPKFPPSMVMEFLLRHHGRTGDSDALLMAERTLRAMAAGGMYDQLGGGFARYSVDAGWVVPHFEKMLYDNALLARVALHVWRSTDRPLGRRIAEETADFMVRELSTPEGGFAAALDADTDGVEGRYYVWNPAQLAELLEPADAQWAAEVFTVTTEGTFEDGYSTLQLEREPDDRERLDRIRRTLLAGRAKRSYPQRDDKVIAAWNGLAIAALAEIGTLLARQDLIDAACRAARLIVDTHHVDDRLRRVSRDGKIGTPAGVLEDYANMAEGLLTLYSVTEDSQWFEAASELVLSMVSDFSDGTGGMFDTAHDAEALVHRPKDPMDNATPSGQAAAAGALLTYAAMTGDEQIRDVAGGLLASTARLVGSAPRFAGWWLSVVEAWHVGPQEVAIVGGSPDDRAQLIVTALGSRSPGVVIAAGDGRSVPAVPLLANRPVTGDGAMAYVCQRFTCLAPTGDKTVLAQQLTPNEP